MLIRIVNLILLLIVVIFAFMLITKRYQSRVDYIALSNLKHEADDLNNEYTRLQLEEGTYSSNLVLKNFAVGQLGLIAPDKQHILEISK